MQQVATLVPALLRLAMASQRRSHNTGATADASVCSILQSLLAGDLQSNGGLSPAHRRRQMSGEGEAHGWDGMSDGGEVEKDQERKR